MNVIMPAGNKIAKSAATRMKEKFPNLKFVYQFYGSTEVKGFLLDCKNLTKKWWSANFYLIFPLMVHYPQSIGKSWETMAFWLAKSWLLDVCSLKYKKNILPEEHKIMQPL